ncbi:hypothetical protein FLONG3_7021 [Fusarium longipes]|uniref:G domain-containing protein n=1 Tax=Fusarium longipes TaxID=694270 RepID=A0A395SHX7_9HYPO|nr:hypothetical protein FLONG3_7021 [Fusarium longipes]
MMDRTQVIPAQSMSPGHTVILVMGITGVGKSTFISKLTGDDVGIGHDLTSYTKGIGIYSMTISGRVTYLIDTPGFNDTWRSDLEILQEVAFIISTIYRRGMTLAGVLYLHRISDNRVSGSAIKNFNLLEKMCGPHAASRVFLITTMWDLTQTGKLSRREAEMRETRLASTEEYWGKLCRQGSRTKRWQGDYRTAQSIVSELLRLNDRSGPIIQRLQRELVDEGKSLAQTAAGRELLTEYELAERKCNDDLSSIIYGERDELTLDNSISELRSQIQEMKVAQQQLRSSMQSAFAKREEAYAKVLHKVRAEQQQLAQEVEKGRQKHERLKADSAANAALLQEGRQSRQMKRQKVEYEERIGRLSRANANAKRREIAEEEEEEIESVKQLNQDNEEERIDTEKAVEKMRKRDVLKRNLFPLLGILGGTGLAVAGVVTGLMPLAGAGGTDAWITKLWLGKALWEEVKEQQGQV